VTVVVAVAILYSVGFLYSEPTSKMKSPNFIDYVKINFRSGKGGAGSVHFRREKFAPKGGPDGGDGGRGGHVILKGNSQYWTLLHLKYRKHIHAEDGEAGTGKGSSGSQGKDVIVDVPLGTIAREVNDNLEGSKMNPHLCEILRDGEEQILLNGGKGGLGNIHFKSSTNQAPQYAQPGIPGKESWIILELKILADVGLVGFPNAGKSTLLSVVSAAKPEIADYPFTTLTPNLGMVSYYDNRSFVMADIPGIIEGASQGKGLGLQFLRHIERNSVLLFIIPADSQDITKEYSVLLNELKQYNPDLLYKKRLLGISKSDLLSKEEIKKCSKNLPDIPYIFFSSHTGSSVSELKNLIWKELNSKR